jgi:1-acyl-sn-glycerol-3-phosphate acyltransferase
MPHRGSALRPDNAARDESTSSVTRLYRLTRLLLQIVYGCAGVAVLFPFFSHKRRLWAIKIWSRQVLRFLHLRLTVRGSFPSGYAPTLIVSNHVSWLDICILNTVLPLRFVAKADVRRWPLVGFLVSRAGTIFIERRNPLDTVRTNRAIAQALSQGEHVAMFPEGTSTDGTEIKPFHASLFQPGLGAVARVVAIALRYVNADGSVNLSASYAGERSLWESFQLVVARQFLHAELIFAGSIDVNGKTRGDIARAAECAIADALQLPRPGRKTGMVGLPGAVPTTASTMDTPCPVRLRSPSAAVSGVGVTADSDERARGAQAWDGEPGQDLLG